MKKPSKYDLFTPEEIEEMRKADEEIEAHDLTFDELKAADARDAEAIKAMEDYKAKKRREYAREYRAKNREIIAKKNRERRLKNREKMKEYQHAYYLAHRNEIAEYKKAWYQKNRETIRARQRVYQERQRSEKHADG